MATNANEQLTHPGGLPYTMSDIAALDDPALEQLMLRGATPSIPSIAGWEFKGRNISAFSAAINLRRFIKGFRPVPPGEENPQIIDGYNLWAWQHRGMEQPWREIKKFGKTWRHGFYKVRPVEPDSIDNKYPNALLIDYSLAKNPIYHPSRNLRDYFTQVYPGNPDLYVGAVFAALGDLRLFTGYFVMERLQQPEVT